MYYYEVVPVSSKYAGREPLTYSYDGELTPGQIVQVNFRKFTCNGFILQKAAKPSFKTQPILSTVQNMVLPPVSLKLFTWMSTYYPGPLGQTAQLFVPSSFKLQKASATAAKAKPSAADKLPPLTAEQKSALKTIIASGQQTFLLHGITGSGKTRVYIELTKQCLKNKQSAIVLTPEISLTPQLVKSFKASFPGQVLLTHSGLSATKRQEVWQKCLSQDGPWVVLGPRSALFAPLKNIGTIIMDEVHDNSYKQDKTPYYQATRVAASLAALAKCQLILGSATPSISEYYFLRSKGIPLLRLSKQALEPTSQTKTKIVDMTNKDNLSKHTLLSKPLISEIDKAIQNKSQSMIFINKRGNAKSIVCQDCGWQAKCDYCDLPLTYHSDNNQFSCHVCGRHYPARTTCKNCQSADIIFKSPGTKTIADNLAKIFPMAKIARFDTDNKKLERIDSRYQEITSGEIDILVGTQILTKGHDLPNLGLAAMLLAESSLSFPDYTSEEKTFQTIRQLSGRVGRGHRDGTVVIQTYNPNSNFINQATSDNYEEFFASQIQERKAYGFPPFYHVMKVLSPRASSQSSQKVAGQIRQQISQNHPECIVLGPSPAFYFKKGGKYNWQLIIKSKNRSSLTSIISELPSGSIANIDPTNLL